MNFALTKELNSQKTAGLWLRCFLGTTIWMLCAGCATCLNAQIDIPGPEHLRHVEGYVVNPLGRPVVDVEVSLAWDNKVEHQTRTDKSGRFRFDHVTGQYTFEVARTEYSPAIREIVVSDEVVTTLERKKLYVILGPGACQDACSSVMTSKREFDRAIRERSRH
jgi:hypothetical protein